MLFFQEVSQAALLLRQVWEVFSESVCSRPVVPGAGGAGAHGAVLLQEELGRSSSCPLALVGVSRLSVTSPSIEVV